MTSCTKCPENSVTEQNGAVSCTSCTAGRFSNEERTKCGNVPFYMCNQISLKINFHVNSGYDHFNSF